MSYRWGFGVICNAIKIVKRLIQDLDCSTWFWKWKQNAVFGGLQTFSEDLELCIEDKIKYEMIIFVSVDFMTL